MLNLMKQMENALLEQILNEAKSPEDASLKASIAEWKLLQKKLAVVTKIAKAVTTRITDLEVGFGKVLDGIEGNKMVVDGALIEYSQKKGNTTVKYKEAVDYALKMVNEAQKKVLEEFIQTVTKSGEIKNVLAILDPDLSKFMIDLDLVNGTDMMDKIEDAARAGFERLPKQVSNASKRNIKEGVSDNINKVVKNLVSKFMSVFRKVFKSISDTEKLANALVKAVKADSLKESKKNIKVTEAVGINKGIRSIVASIRAIDMESDTDSLDESGLRSILKELLAKWEESSNKSDDKSSMSVTKTGKMLEAIIKTLPKPEESY